MSTRGCSLVYKKVANKVPPRACSLPEDFCNLRRIPEDPPAPPFPSSYHSPDFVPGLRLTQDHLNLASSTGFDFLWPEELKLLQHILKGQ